MRDELARRGWIVNRKQVQRLMRLMGLQAIYPRRRSNQPAPGHQIYPYRLRALNIDRPNQVWAADITYIPMAQRFINVPGHHPRMDSRDRWMDNACVERLWRTVKYEDICLRACETPAELRAGLDRYFRFYNTRRGHAAVWADKPR